MHTFPIPQRAGERGDLGTAQHWQRAEWAEDSAQLPAPSWCNLAGQGSAVAGPFPSAVGGTGLPNSRRVRAPEPSWATPAPSSSKCAHLAHVCSSKHPPAPGNSHIGPEPMWAKICAVRSDPLQVTLTS